MKAARDKKWVIECIIIALMLSIAIINSVVLHMQNNILKKEAVSNMNAEWYQLYRLTEIIDKNYIKNNFIDGAKFQLLVNQTCYHFTLTGRPSELTVNMRKLLTQAYDPLFLDLCLEKGSLDKEKASEILKGMNDDLMQISKGIIDMKDNQKEKLLELTSREYIAININVKNIAEKYTKLVDDYFSGFNQASELSTEAKNKIKKVSEKYGEKNPKIIRVNTIQEEVTKKTMYIVFLKGDFQKGEQKSQNLEFSMTEDGKKVWALISDSWQETEINLLN